MAERRVLLIDTDKKFHDTLVRALAPYGVTVHVVDDGSDGLNQVPGLDPEMIFITVELPDKVGYSICNKAKKGVAKRIPVVLTTASVPPADLATHRKLKVHADEYIDKRTASTDELVRKVDGLINLGPPVEPLEELQVDAEDIHFDEEVEEGAPAPADATHVAPPHLVDPGIDAETDAVFAGLMDEPLGVHEGNDSEPVFDAVKTGVRSVSKVLAAPPPLPPPPGANTTEPEPGHESIDLGQDFVAGESEPEPERQSYADGRVEELEREVERLGRELEEAKRAAPPVPAATSFSREREFLNLREVINRKEKELLDLREEVDTKDRFILGGKDKIRELDRKLRDHEEKLLGFEGQVVTANETNAALKDDKDKALEREKGLKARIDIAQKQLAKADEEFENLKKRSAAEAQALNAEIAARKKELETEKKNASDRVAGLEAVHIAALKKGDGDRQAQLARAAEDKESALAAMTRDYTGQLERAKAAGEAAQKALRDEGQKALAALTAEKDGAFARLDQQRKDQLAKAADEKAQALAEAEDKRQLELKAAEERRVGELATAEEQRRHEVTELRESGQHALDELTATKDGELAALSDEMQKALAAAEDRRQKELAAAEGKRKDDLTAAEDRRGRELTAADERRMKELLAADSKRREEMAAAEDRRQKEAAAAEDRRVRELATADDKHTRELGALTKNHEEATAQAQAARAAEASDLRGEIATLEAALATTRTKLAATETELGRTANALRDREAEGARLSSDLADREKRLAEARTQIDDLEKENASYQEQLLRAFQKIKNDEAVANKAKKAMAIALTLLDGEPVKQPAANASE